MACGPVLLALTLIIASAGCCRALKVGILAAAQQQQQVQQQQVQQQDGSAVPLLGDRASAARAIFLQTLHGCPSCR